MGPVPGRARGARAECAAAQPLPRRRHVPPAQRARRAARGRPGADRHGRGRRRDHRPSLGRRPRPGRRGRHGLAVVHQLRPRHVEARRDAGARAVARPPPRPGGDARGDRAADEARLHRDAQQPHRHDDRPRCARRVLRAGARARADGARPGLPRVHRPPGLPGRDRGVRQARPARARPAHLLEDLRARRVARGLRRRRGRDDHRDRQGPSRLRREHRRHRSPRSPAWTTRQSCCGGGRSPQRAATSSHGPCGPTGSSLPALPSRTSSSPMWPRTHVRSSKRSCGRAQSCARWARSVRPEPCGSPSAPRRRTRSSPTRLLRSAPRA